jgi:osmotically-inducible protein OsmY
MKTKKLIVSAAFVAALMTRALSVRADSTAIVDLTPQLQSAGIDIDGLQAVDVGGIVVLRGTTTDATTAARAAVCTQSLGYTRVANLIRVVEPPDDAVIARVAERRLAMHRSLDGCRLRVDSSRGIITVAGKVNSETQKDIAVDLLRNIDGVRSVKADFRY